MTTIDTTKKGLDRTIWQPMSPAPVTNAAAMFTISQTAGWDEEVVYVTAIATIYMYNAKEDSWIQLPTSASAGTFGAAACGAFHDVGPNGTASAGSTTTITTSLTFNRRLDGFVVRITGGTNAGQQRLIKSNTLGANSVLTVTDAFSSPIDGTSTYTIYSGRYWFFCPSTTAPGFNYYDRATNAWTSRTVSGLATSWGTDAKLVASSGARSSRDITPREGLPIVSSTSTTITTGQNWQIDQLTNRMVYVCTGTGVGQYRQITSNTSNVITYTGGAFSPALDTTSRYYVEGFSTGTATSGGATTLNDTGKAWTTSQWINFQVRIVAGAGSGEVRLISANTGTQLTIASGTAIDSTSVYIIECDENAMYLLGNNAVTMYKYSISGNSWSTLSPGVARAAAPGAGMSANLIAESTDTSWTTDTAIINGRRIYSFRGAAGAVLDYYDIPSNAWTNAITYLPATETFTTGTSWEVGNDGNIFCNRSTSNTGPRFFKFSPVAQRMMPLSTLVFPDSTATLGDKIFSWTFVDGDTQIQYVYYLSSTLTNLFRMKLI
jgi:hypothetical protein